MRKTVTILLCIAVYLSIGLAWATRFICEDTARDNKQTVR